jgi:hypothetical protein
MTDHASQDRRSLRRRVLVAALWIGFGAALVASQAVLYEPGLIALLLDPELVAVTVVAGLTLLRYDLMAMALGLLRLRRSTAADDLGG